MGLRPRHYLLLLVILSVGIWRVLHLRAGRPQINAAAPTPTVSANLAPAPSGSPATWVLFDQAAALRDGDDAAFQPALKKLNAQPDVDSSDVSGCKTWLLFYRQGKLHPSADTSWQTRSTEHLDNCVKLHRDAAR